jgi:hypothetical protein
MARNSAQRTTYRVQVLEHAVDLTERPRSQTSTVCTPYITDSEMNAHFLLAGAFGPDVASEHGETRTK